MKKVIVTLLFSLLFTTTIFSVSIPPCLLLFHGVGSLIDNMSHAERQELKDLVIPFMNQSENGKVTFPCTNSIITYLTKKRCYSRNRMVWDTLYTPKALLGRIEWADENQRKRW